MILALAIVALGLVLLHNTAESIALAAIEAMRACRRARRADPTDMMGADRS